jgi:6-phosphogluconolactonase
MRRILFSIIFTLVALVGLTAAFATAVSADPGPYWGAQFAQGAVYTMTNAASGNAVVMYTRDANGMLTPVGSFPTGGNGFNLAGPPDPLGSQNSLILTQDGKWLLAVNAGSNTITVFQVKQNGLKAVDWVSSGGILPVSLTISGNEVFVLNDGDSTHVGDITGFNLRYNGDLDPIWGSTRWLPVGGPQDFGQVGFDNTGSWLIVTDKADSNILVYSMGWDKTPATNPVTYLDPGVVPFGFIFDAIDNLVVVQAADSAVSSYRVKFDGTLKVISQSISNGDSTACWIAQKSIGPIFTTNPGATGTISSFKDMFFTGNITLLNGSAATGIHTIDEGLSNDGQYLYALAPGVGIDGFKVSPNGNLTSLGTFAESATSGFVQGIAVR